MIDDTAVQHPSSYRDPSGFVFTFKGEVYRQVNQSFQKDFQAFVQSGLYEELVAEGLLIPHQALHQNITGDALWFTTLKPEPISFISYLYEWCFSMLKDAALLTLKLARKAIEHELILKDASPYNVQFHKGKMIFIDSLSFACYNENEPWIAYRQFCENFLAPLALMHYVKRPLQQLSIAYPEGLPMQLTKQLLPFKSRFNVHTYLHLHLHSSIISKTNESKKARPFSRQKMMNILQSLEECVQAFSLNQKTGVWSDYYEEAHQRDDYIISKKQIVDDWLSQIKVKTVFDAGANEGEFSELAAAKSSHVISADFDHYSVDNLYKKVQAKNSQNILPLVIDLANPSPAVGVNNEERPSFLQRLHVDLILALAVIHHLVIGKNIPFEKIATLFKNVGSFLIIEFVPKTDEKVQLMLKKRTNQCTDYSGQNFEIVFAKYFSIVSKKIIGNSGRTIYLMKNNE